jgi:hypothetical protein
VGFEPTNNGFAIRIRLLIPHRRALIMVASRTGERTALWPPDPPSTASRSTSAAAGTRAINGHWKQVVGKREAPTAADADRVYEERFAELWAGVDQAPRAPLTQAQIADLFDHYLNAKRLERDAPNGIRPRTYDEYRACCRTSVTSSAAPRYTDLSPMIFTHVHQAWRRKYGPHRLRKYVTIVRGAFNWLKANGFIGDVPQYGDFASPAAPTSAGTAPGLRTRASAAWRSRRRNRRAARQGRRHSAAGSDPARAQRRVRQHGPERACAAPCSTSTAAGSTTAAARPA